MNTKLLEFIKESNRIEGITVYNETIQYDLYCEFLNLEEVTDLFILKFAESLHQSSMDSNREFPRLRNQKGMNVRVGSHVPIEGGIKVQAQLNLILHYVNNRGLTEKDAYKIHHGYETLHPLTDCNGRTGRVLWAWMMNKLGYDFGLGFLHKWYYQSLSYGEKR